MESWSWKLAHVYVENFKSIKSCSVNIPDGFTVITGPNGSGKSNFLESITFGLGTGASNIRLSSLKSIGNVNNTSRRTVVKLTFRKDDKEFMVGSSLVDDKRLYHINTATVSREKFCDALTELGFSRHSFCWNISQHAVQDIITATPAILHQTLSYISNTSKLLENQTKALAQVQLFANDISSINRKMGALEGVLGATDRMFELVEQLSQASMERARVVRVLHIMEELRLLRGRLQQTSQLRLLSLRLRDIRCSLGESLERCFALEAKQASGTGVFPASEVVQDLESQSEESLVAMEESLRDRLTLHREEFEAARTEIQELRTAALTAGQRAGECRSSLYRTGGEREQLITDITGLVGRIDSIKMLMAQCKTTSASFAADEYWACKQKELTVAESKRLQAESESISLTTNMVRLQAQVDRSWDSFRNDFCTVQQLARDFQQQCSEMKHSLHLTACPEGFDSGCSELLVLLKEVVLAMTGHDSVTLDCSELKSAEQFHRSIAPIFVAFADKCTRVITAVKDMKGDPTGACTRQTPLQSILARANKDLLPRLETTSGAIRSIGKRLALPDLFLNEIPTNFAETSLNADNSSVCSDSADRSSRFLLELVTPRLRASTGGDGCYVLTKYAQALRSLMEPFLSVRVCRTDEEAARIVKRVDVFNRSHAAAVSMKIWPLENLQVQCSGVGRSKQAAPSAKQECRNAGDEFLDPGYSNFRLIAELSARLLKDSTAHSHTSSGESPVGSGSHRIVDPASLLLWAPSRDSGAYPLLDRAVKKAVGQWLFVESEELAHRVLDLVKRNNAELDERRRGQSLAGKSGDTSSETADFATMIMISRVSGCITPDGRRHVLGVLYLSKPKPTVPSGAKVGAACMAVSQSSAHMSKLCDWGEYASLSATLDKGFAELGAVYSGLRQETKKRALATAFVETAEPLLNGLTALLPQLDRARADVTAGESSLERLRIKLDLVQTALSKYGALVKAARLSLQQQSPSGDKMDSMLAQYECELRRLQAEKSGLEQQLAESADLIVELEEEFLALTGTHYVDASADTTTDNCCSGDSEEGYGVVSTSSSLRTDPVSPIDKQIATLEQLLVENASKMDQCSLERDHVVTVLAKVKADNATRRAAAFARQTEVSEAQRVLASLRLKQGTVFKKLEEVLTNLFPDAHATADKPKTSDFYKNRAGTSVPASLPGLLEAFVADNGCDFAIVDHLGAATAAKLILSIDDCDGDGDALFADSLDRADAALREKVSTKLKDALNFDPISSYDGDSHSDSSEAISGACEASRRRHGASLGASKASAASSSASTSTLLEGLVGRDYTAALLVALVGNPCPTAISQSNAEQSSVGSLPMMNIALVDKLRSFVDTQYVHYKSKSNQIASHIQELLAETLRLVEQNQLMKSMLPTLPCTDGSSSAELSPGALSVLTKDPEFCSYLSSISSKILVLKTKYQQTVSSVDSLRHIVGEIQTLTRQVHARVFVKLRTLFRFFHRLLVPSTGHGTNEPSIVELVPVMGGSCSEDSKSVQRTIDTCGIVGQNREEDLENGFTFQLLRGGSKTKTKTKSKASTADINVGGDAASSLLISAAMSELSGGQRAMLGLSFVFAVLTINAPSSMISILDKSDTRSGAGSGSGPRINSSLGSDVDLSQLLAAPTGARRNPVYLLDEVDAALDETNQKLLSRVIIALFRSRSQVLCVSHHPEFQKNATSTIPVLMQEDGFSKIG